MRWCLRVLARSLWVVACTAWLVACESAGPALIAVRSIGPSEVHVGEQLEVRGRGFPAGRPATLTLSGELALPGVAPRRVRLDLPAVAGSDSLLEVPLPLEHDALLCGVEDGLRHASFRGRARVVFEPVSDAAPPVYGRLDDLRLELFPGGASAESVGRDREQTKAVQGFLGLGQLSSLARQGNARGLRVDALAPDSRAAQFGVQPHDVLLQADGVTLFSEFDLLLREDQQFLTLELERPAAVGASAASKPARRLLVRVPTQGFAGHRPLALTWSSVLVGGVALAVWLSFGALGRVWGWLQVWRRLRERQFAAARGGPSYRVSGGWWFLPKPELAWCFIAAAAGAWLIRSGTSSASWLVTLALLTTWTFSAVGALAAGGSRRARSWSLFGGLRAFGHHALVSAPAAILLGANLWLRGDARLVSDAAVAERVLLWPVLQNPWEPLAALALAVWVLPLRVDSRGVGAAAASASVVRSLYRSSQALGFAVVAFAISSVFLGGWTSASLDRGDVWTLVLFETKYLAVVLGLAAFRRALGGGQSARRGLVLAELGSVMGRLVLRYGVALASAFALWVYLRPFAVFQWFTDLLPQALVLGGAVALVVTGLRRWLPPSARRGAAVASSRGSELNPWL